MKTWPLWILALATATLGYLLVAPTLRSSPQSRIANPKSPIPPTPVTYWTQPGLEPDTCVAAWLLTRIVSPGARIDMADHSTIGTPFDVPGTDLQRLPGSSASDVVAERFHLHDPFSVALVAVARELELKPWTTNDDVFFMTIRAGLADALNASDDDATCMNQALTFLDTVQRSHPGASPTPTDTP